MKFLFKMSTICGISAFAFLFFSYTAKAQWENAMCMSCCITLLIACRYYEWKAEEAEKMSDFIIGNFYEKMNQAGKTAIVKDFFRSIGKGEEK